MEQRIPVNRGRVDWAGDNPAIFLREDVNGPWTGLGIFFNVTYSQHGRGYTMIALGEPTASRGYPDSLNICITNNKELTNYLLTNFVSKFPAFVDQPGLSAMTVIEAESHQSGGDMKTSWYETVSASDVQIKMEWKNLATPMAVEVGPENCVTKLHDMYSVFFEAKDAVIYVNQTPLKGVVTDRQFFGRTMSTAFLAVSETWVIPESYPSENN